MADYKDTLLMPKTSFEMRGNLGVREPLFQQAWEENNIYKKRIEKNKDKTPFVLHDGPPYANGFIHIGHALNKVLKDIVVRYKNMNGFQARYIPGWDTHGLPIEVAVTKSGVNRKTMGIAEFRKKCNEYAHVQVSNQMKGFKRLGVLGEFENPYLTLLPEFEAEQIRVFAKMCEKGLIFKGLKPVYWSPSSESALAEAEIEYQDIVSKSIYFKLPIVNGENEFKDASFMVWTTTPWTLPGNLAVAAGPDILYVVFESNKGKMICAKELLETIIKKLNLEDVKEIALKKGNELLDLKYKHPLYDRISPVINADYVTTTDGTGFVHIAPGYGEEDYMAGKNYGLEILVCVDDKGYQTEKAGKYQGLFYEQSEDVIIEDLKALDCLLLLDPIKHSYPHDWRTKKPVIFRATPQWFASIEKIKTDLLDAVKTVKWYPSWGELRISNMIKDRKDWCISRQRAWGVPIPVFYAENGEAIMDPKLMMHVADLFEKEGSDIWYTKEASELLPEGYTNPLSPNGVFKKELDTMDVWFDSGSSHQAVCKKWNLPYPTDLYLEGADQYRGWFNSSLITGVSVTGKSPYKTIVTHGFTLDGEGRKMSKSLGNTIDPNKVMEQKGADILRLWVASVEYQADQRISEEIMKQVSESYRKIRNTFKFMLGALNDFDESKKVDENELNDVDKYMLIKLNNLIKQVKNAYDEYRFNDVYRTINSYIATLLSPFYLDFTKDILYIEEENSKNRRSVQTVFFETLTALLKLLTPIIPHTCSEAYKCLNLKEEDVYLCDMPEAKEYKFSDVEAKFDSFMQLRNEILKSLEQARNEKVIGKSFESELIITPTKEVKELIDSLNSNVAQLCIVSKLTINDVNDELKIEVKKAEGSICDRCWMIVPFVNTNGLCPRCESILNKLK